MFFSPGMRNELERFLTHHFPERNFVQYADDDLFALFISTAFKVLEKEIGELKPREMSDEERRQAMFNGIRSSPSREEGEARREATLDEERLDPDEAR